MHIEVDGHQQTILCIAVVLKKLYYQLIAACKGTLPVPMMQFVCMLRVVLSTVPT
jgi:hypothetical protein